VIKLLNPIRKLLADDEGATMVEYGLLIILIALICAVALIPLGKEVKDIFEDVSVLF